MLLWPGHLEPQYFLSHNCEGERHLSRLKSQIICREKTRLVTSIASSCVCSMQLASSWRKRAGKAAVKMHRTSHGTSTVCFHHDQKIWKRDRKKSTSRTRKGIFLFEYDTTDCKAISRARVFSTKSSLKWIESNKYVAHVTKWIWN